ncbi:MAG TPA: lipase family protein, partial [Clostridiaceae bacterium]|nr:lipase family protein [Clostridiaceae bacterium]
MSNRIITSQSTKIKTVFVGKQKKQTIVVEIVDEINQPVSGINYTISNQEGVVFSDKTTNELGQIIIEDAEYRDYWLTLDAQNFVLTMENRSLRVDRNKSTVELRAKDEKCNYRYAVIGELCDSKPRIGDSESLPDFHFPNKTFKGVCLPANTLNKKLIIEVCPFRAWNFVFENTDNYSLINAYNMALLSNIAYLKNGEVNHPNKRSNVNVNDTYISTKNFIDDGRERERKKSVNYFFNHACLDLDDQPYIFEEGVFQLQPIVKDVPFRDRYTEFNYLSSVDEEGSTLVKMRDFLAGHSTQLFYILSRKEAIIVWRGTETTATDINTDLKFSQKTEMLCEVAAGNLSCVQDTKLHVKATVHKGFQTAFNAVVRKEVQKFFEFRSSFENRKVFIGGHSLGGALALLYAITQRDKNIVLYTYGMPRTINKFSVDNLNNLVHYRHVNENDIVPTV